MMSDNNTPYSGPADELITLRLQLALVTARAAGNPALARECQSLRTALGVRPTVAQVERARAIVGR